MKITHAFVAICVAKILKTAESMHEFLGRDGP